MHESEQNSKPMICTWCGADRPRIVIHTVQWDIVACRRCANAWTNPPPLAQPYDAEDFHAQFEFERVMDLPHQWLTALTKQVHLLKKYVQPGGAVLEIGCGQGLLMELLASEKFSVTGIEPSRAASSRAREKGFNVITGYFPHEELKQHFDAVILSQVVEHVAEPLHFINQVQQKVRSGGVVLFVQTNWRGLMPRLLKEQWYAWVPQQHYWHFTPKGMAFILRKLNFKVEAVEYSSLEHGDRRLSHLGELFPNLGDQFHLVARCPLRRE